MNTLVFRPALFVLALLGLAACGKAEMPTTTPPTSATGENLGGPTGTRRLGGPADADGEQREGQYDAGGAQETGVVRDTGSGGGERPDAPFSPGVDAQVRPIDAPSESRPDAGRMEPACMGSCTPGTTGMCGRCGSRVCKNDCMWGVCENEGLCAAGEARSCGKCGTETCSATCQWSGSCDRQGTCTPGSMEACGNCGTRACLAACTWTLCGNEGTCAANQTRACGKCGVERCGGGSGCGWTGVCESQGACAPGETRSCGNCGTETCGSNCRWSGTCSGEGVCKAGITGTCGNCGRGSMTCTSTCQWGACAGASTACTPGTTQACGNCMGGTQTCTNMCDWGACSGASGCAPGATEACGNCNQGTRTCSNTCAWSACAGAGECSAGMIEDCATVPQIRICGNACSWGQCSCQGSPGGWNGCRGSGCLVCAENTVDFPYYFSNHPLCDRNDTCGGLFLPCNLNCPTPTDADKAPVAGACNGTSGQWAGCRGNGCAVCTEKLVGYPKYMANHPRCVANPTCAGLFGTCNSYCPAPSAADQ